jgi:hypothetical protein
MQKRKNEKFAREKSIVSGVFLTFSGCSTNEKSSDILNK